MDIREATEEDLAAVLEVHRQAFGSEVEPELTRILLADPAAQPLISLLAEEEGSVVGHVLFTRSSVDASSSMMVAPVGVVPGRQNGGVGSRLTREAIEQARKDGVELLFLAGHPAYYPRFGFQTRAEDLGFTPPVPMPPEHAEAWMVMELVPGAIARYSGHVTAADELMDPKYWSD